MMFTTLLLFVVASMANEGLVDIKKEYAEQMRNAVKPEGEVKYWNRPNETKRTGFSCSPAFLLLESFNIAAFQLDAPPVFKRGPGSPGTALSFGDFRRPPFSGPTLYDTGSIRIGRDGNVYVAAITDGVARNEERKPPLLTYDILRYRPDGRYIDTFISGIELNPDTRMFFIFGPDGNIYAIESVEGFILKRDNYPPPPIIYGTGQQVSRYNGITGEFMDIFVENQEVELDHVCEKKRCDRSPPTYAAGSFDSFTFGPDGDLYVANENGGAQRQPGSATDILRFNGQTGAFVLLFIDGTILPLTNVYTLVWYNNELYIGSSNNGGGGTVERYDRDGNYVGQFVVPGDGGLFVPTEIAFRNGYLYVSTLILFKRANAPTYFDKVLRYDGSSGTFIDVYISEEENGFTGTGFVFLTCEPLPGLALANGTQ